MKKNSKLISNSRSRQFKIVAYSFYLTLMILLVLAPAAKVFAAIPPNCKVDPLWFIQNSSGNNSAVTQTTITTTSSQTYLAVVNFTNCSGLPGPQIQLFDNVTPGGLGVSNVASSITSNSEQHNMPVTFKKSGEYFFRTYGRDGGEVFIQPESPHLIVTINNSAPPANATTYNQCVVDEVAQNADNPQADCCKLFPNDASCKTAATGASYNQCVVDEVAQNVDNPQADCCKQYPNDPACTAATGGTTGGGAPPANGMSNNSSDKLYNPLPEEELTHAFLIIIQGFLGIVGIWAVMFIIVGGFQMVMASGNEEMYLKAKKTLTWAVLGLAVALLSFSIIAIVQDLLQATIKPPTSSISRDVIG